MSGGDGTKWTTMNYTALGGPTTDELSEFRNTTRISGTGISMAGSNLSEKKRISGVEKDIG